MKFCMITTFYPPYNFGGDGIFVYRLARSLADQGHEVDVIHCRDAYLMFEPGGPRGDYPEHPGITVHGLHHRLGPVSPVLTQLTGYPVLKRRAIDRILHEQQFDVIHYHNISLVGGPHLLQPRREITLYTMHEYWLLCPTHFLWKPDRTNCSGGNCFFCSLARKKLPQLWRSTRMLERLAANVDCFIAPSRFTMNLYRNRGFKGSMVHIPLFLPEKKQKKGTQKKGTDLFFWDKKINLSPFFPGTKK